MLHSHVIVFTRYAYFPFILTANEQYITHIAFLTTSISSKSYNERLIIARMRKLRFKTQKDTNPGPCSITNSGALFFR